MLTASPSKLGWISSRCQTSCRRSWLIYLLFPNPRPMFPLLESASPIVRWKREVSVTVRSRIGSLSTQLRFSVIDHPTCVPSTFALRLGSSQRSSQPIRNSTFRTKSTSSSAVKSIFGPAHWQEAFSRPWSTVSHRNALRLDLVCPARFHSPTFLGDRNNS